MCHTPHNHCIITHLFATLVSLQSGAGSPRRREFRSKSATTEHLRYHSDITDLSPRFLRLCAEVGGVLRGHRVWNRLDRWMGRWRFWWHRADECRHITRRILCTDSLKVSISNISFSAFWEGVAEVGPSHTSLKSLPSPYQVILMQIHDEKPCPGNWRAFSWNYKLRNVAAQWGMLLTILFWG